MSGANQDAKAAAGAAGVGSTDHPEVPVESIYEHGAPLDTQGEGRDADVVEVSQQVLWGATDGECHLLLPVFIDPMGSCHVSLGKWAQLETEEELGRVLSGVFQGASAAAEHQRRHALKTHILKALGEASRQFQHVEERLGLSQGDGEASQQVEPQRSQQQVQVQQQQQHHVFRRVLARLHSLERHRPEAKDALRHSVLSKRSRDAAVGKEVVAPRVFYLEYSEQRFLPWH